MTLFRVFLVACLAVIVPYTAFVVSRHGLDLLPVFFGDIARMGWAGQFNLDFLALLLLAALWLAWRHGFGARGLVLAALVPVGGTPFLALYLLVQSVRTGGDMTALLLGETRARRG